MSKAILVKDNIEIESNIPEVWPDTSITKNVAKIKGFEVADIPDGADLWFKDIGRRTDDGARIMEFDRYESDMLDSV